GGGVQPITTAAMSPAIFYGRSLPGAYGRPALAWCTGFRSGGRIASLSQGRREGVISFTADAASGYRNRVANGVAFVRRRRVRPREILSCAVNHNCGEAATRAAFLAAYSDQA